MFGGTAVRLCVPSILETDSIECMFGGSALNGVYLSVQEVLCVSPRFSQPGPVELQVTIIREGDAVFYGEKTFTAREFTCCAP